MVVIARRGGRALVEGGDRRRRAFGSRPPRSRLAPGRASKCRSVTAVAGYESGPWHNRRRCAPVSARSGRDGGEGKAVAGADSTNLCGGYRLRIEETLAVAAAHRPQRLVLG